MEPFVSASSLSFCSFHGRPVGSFAASHSQNSFHFFCAHAVWKQTPAACHTAEPPGTRRACPLSRVLLTPATRKIVSDQGKVELGRGPCVPMCVMCAHVYMCTHVYMCAHVCPCVRVPMCVHVCPCVYMCVHVCTCMRVCMRDQAAWPWDREPVRGTERGAGRAPGGLVWALLPTSFDFWANR